LGFGIDGDRHEQTAPLIIGSFLRLPKGVEEPGHNHRIPKHGDYRCQSESEPSPNQEPLVEAAWFGGSGDKTADAVALPANKGNPGRITEEFLI